MTAKKQRKGRDASPVRLETAASPLVSSAIERTQVNKFHTGTGHGFAAEDANHLEDILRGKSAKLVGGDNALNGADRIVEGVHIQSKYCKNAAETIEAAFEPGGGKFRYAGQVIEVPRDQFEACVQKMREKIDAGRVPGVSDPAKAEELVKEGHFTYRQAVNIAKAGTVESLTFDAKEQIVGCTKTVLPISFVVSFAVRKWRGESARDAALGAAGDTARATGISILAGVAARQALRTRTAAAFAAGAARNGVRMVAGSSAGRIAVQRLASTSLGKPVYGAAATNHVAKLMRTNVVTGVVATVAISTPSIYRAFVDKSISKAQLSKDVAVNAAGVAAGFGGWIVGAEIGAAVGSLIPGAGTVVFGIVGGIIGGIAAGVGGDMGARHIADKFVEDDAVAMEKLLREELAALAEEHLLSQAEWDSMLDNILKIPNGKWLRSLFAKGEDEARRSFVREVFEPLYIQTTGRRERQSAPGDEILSEAAAFESQELA